MTTQMVTSPTGSSLQRLAERSWERTAAGSQLYYEDQHWTGIQLAERSRGWPAGCARRACGPASGSSSAWPTAPRSASAITPSGGPGAVATPVLFLLSEDELRHVLSDSGAVLAITTPEFLPKVTAAAAGVDGAAGDRRRPGRPRN